MLHIKKILSKILSKIDIYPIILVFLSFISHTEWFNINSVLFFGDWQHRTNTFTSQIINFARATWLSDTSFGSQNIQINMFLPTYIWGIIGKYEIATKLTYFLPIAIISVLSPYYLLKNIVKSKKISFLGALLYGFSSYLIMRSTAHLPIAFIYSLAPFILLIFIKLLNKFSSKNIIYFSLIYFLGCVYEIRIMYLVSFILIIYFIIFFNKKEFWKNKHRYLFPLVLIILLNLFWLLPTIFEDKQNMTTTINRDLFGNWLYSTLNSFAFFDSKWTGGLITNNFIASPIKLYFWIIPITSVLSFFQFRNETKNNKKYIIYFGLILLTGILFAKQADNPFPNLYLWFYNNFPGFNLFREASKFYLLLGIGYLGLFAFGIKFILSIIKKKQLQILILILFATILIFNIKSLVTKEIGTLFINREIPQEYKTLEKKILSNNNYYRTLWIPFSSQFAYYDIKHPKISLWTELTNQKINYWDKKGISAFSKISPYLKNFKKPLLYSNIFDSLLGKDLLDNTSIKYLIIPTQLPESIENIFPYAGDKQNYVKEFDKIKFLTKEKIGDLTVYENKNYKPHIFAVNNIFLFKNSENLNKKYKIITKKLKNKFYFTVEENNKDFQNLSTLNKIKNKKNKKPQEINFELVNPTKKIVRIKGATTPFFLNTSESYHQQWQLEMTNKKNTGIINKWSPFSKPDKIADENHYKLNSFLNSWYIDTNKLCQNNSGCQKNKDESYDLEMTIEFWPQRWFYLGLIISSLTLFSCLVYLLFIFAKKIWRKKQKA